MKLTRSRQWPYRQSDPQWARAPMWKRADVMEVHRKFNHASIDPFCHDGNPYSTGPRAASGVVFAGNETASDRPSQPSSVSWLNRVEFADSCAYSPSST